MHIDSIHLKNLYEYAQCRNLNDDFELNQYLASETTMIPAKIFLEYAEYLYKKSNDEYFGLHFGAFLSFKAMNIIFDISLTASSIKQLALIWGKYASISFPLIQIATVGKTDEYCIIFNGDFQSDLGAQILDAILFFSYKELKIITKADLISVTIPNKNIAEYELCYDCPIVHGNAHKIKFNCSSDLIITNKKMRNRIEILLPAFLYYLESLKSSETSFAHKVKLMTLNLCEPNCPSIEQVAAQFCVSTRTLQRKLKNEDTSYRAISNELKKELYTYLEKGSNLKTIDKSYLLGYSSSSAFLHALKSWGF